MDKKKTIVNFGRISPAVLKLRTAGYARKAPCATDEVKFPAGNFNEHRNFRPTWAQEMKSWTNTLDNPKPIGAVTKEKTWVEYMGEAIIQTDGTCALVACILCMEAVYGFSRKKKQNTDRPAALKTLLTECISDDIWVEGKGAYVGDVLKKMQEMRTVLNTTGSPSRALSLVSWQEHVWGDNNSGTGFFSPEDVAALLDIYGPCIGVLWVCPWYKYMDADRNDALVYRGCGRNVDHMKSSEELYPVGTLRVKPLDEPSASI